MILPFLLVIVPVILIDIGFLVYFVISRFFPFAIIAGVVAVALTALAVIVSIQLGRGKEDNDNVCNVWTVLNGHIPHKPKKGVLAQITKDGLKYIYDKTELIFVPFAYAPVYQDGKRTLYVTHAGELITRPFFGTDKALEACATCKLPELLKEMVTGHLGADIVRAVKSSKKNYNSIVAIVLVFLLLVAGVAAFSYTQSKKAQPVQPAAQPVQPIDTPLITPIEKE